MVNRYQDLLAALPTGQFYQSLGEVLPYLDAPHQFRFSTDKPNRSFDVSFNGVPYPPVTTDGSGVAIVAGRDKVTRLPLDPGEYDIAITDQTDGREYHFYVTIKNIATWFAAYADVLEQLDAEIDDANNGRTLENAPASYIETAFGAAVRQPRPTTFLVEDYRNMLRQLRQAYRHFGAHPFGVQQAVSSFTSVSPIIIPQAWRPHWILGTQLIDNGKFQERSRLSTAELGPAGAIAGSPTPELPDLNRQSRFWVHPSVGAVSPPTSAFRAPPYAQPLTVTFGATNQSVLLVGLDESGATVSETVPDPSITGAIATYQTQLSYESIISAVLSGAGPNVLIGIAQSRFVRLDDVGPYNRPNNTLDLTPLRYHGLTTAPLSADGTDAVASLSWGGGPNTSVQSSVVTPFDLGTDTTLHDESRHAWAIGTVPESGTYNLNPRASVASNDYHDRVGIEVDGLGLLIVDVGTGSSITAVADTDVRDRINAALLADPRYGASFTAGTNGASIITDTQGGTKSTMTLKSPAEDTLSRVKFHPIPCDAGPEIFGLPFTTTRLAFDVSPGSRTLFVKTGHGALFPQVASTDPNDRRRFKIRVRCLRVPSTSGDIYTVSYPLNVPLPLVFDNLVAVVAVHIPGYTFTASDVGGYVRWTDSDSHNVGLHQIIGLAGPVSAASPYGGTAGDAYILHENSVGGARFTYPLVAHAGSGAVYHPGETLTVIDNGVLSGPDSLTTDSALPAPFAWPAEAIVELVDDAPYEARGTSGLGTVDVVVDAQFRPFHDFGDSISFVNGIDATGGMRLTSARADFLSVINGTTTIEVSSAENLENDGTFVVTAHDGVSGLYVDFTNLDGIQEGVSPAPPSTFEWELLPAPSVVEDDLLIYGSDMPDGWLITSASTAVVCTNVDDIADSTTPGLLVPSRVVLTGPSVQFQRDVPRAWNDYKGFPLSLSIWLQEHTTNNTEYLIEVSFDGGSVFHTVIDTTVPITILQSVDSSTGFVGPQFPSSLEGSFFVPYDAVSCIIRLTRSPSDATVGTMSIEQMSLRSTTGTGLAVGDNTVPRSQKRAKFGELLYVWSAEPLTSEEGRYLGLPQASDILPNADNSIGVSTAKTPGHIDYITNSHGYYDRFDVSELDDSGSSLVRFNLRGTYDSTDWLALQTADTLTNVEVVIGTPSRMSYVRPTRISAVTSEPLAMLDGGDGPGTARANLANTSDHDGNLSGPLYPQAPNTGRGTGARLYEAKPVDVVLTNSDGLVTVIPAGTPIPVTDTIDDNSIQPWEFTSISQIRINAPYFDPASTYSLDYDVLIRATGRTFQLQGTGMVKEDYVWLLDSPAYRRHEVIERFVPRIEQAQFIADFTAPLSERADMTSPATLTRNNGLIQETVNFADWSFVDSKTIKITPTVFDNNSIYTISYTAKVPHVQAVPNLLLEWRAAENESDLLSDVVPWTQIDPTELAQGKTVSPFFIIGSDVSLNHVLPWHQMRVSAYGVIDVRDFRLYGMGIKGLHLFGASPHAPGILTPT